MSKILDPRNELEARDQRILNREVYFKGKDIITQGGGGFRAYYIDEGRVEVLVKKGVHQLQVAELEAGDVFGEMALINDEPRSATVRALEETTVTVISRDEIKEKIESVDDVAMQALIHVLAERLRDATQDQLEHFIHLSEFQERVFGIIDKLDIDIEESKRPQFHEDIKPLLNDLQSVLDRYRR